jgi:hypothetical protein
VAESEPAQRTREEPRDRKAPQHLRHHREAPLDIGCRKMLYDITIDCIVIRRMAIGRYVAETGQFQDNSTYGLNGHSAPRATHARRAPLGRVAAFQGGRSKVASPAGTAAWNRSCYQRPGAAYHRCHVECVMMAAIGC